MKRWGNVAIVGVGLIGGSIGLALRQRNLAESVIGIGRRQVSLRIARRVGAVTHTTIDLAKGVADAELVIVCTPVGQIVEHVRAGRRGLSGRDADHRRGQREAGDRRGPGRPVAPRLPLPRRASHRRQREGGPELRPGRPVRGPRGRPDPHPQHPRRGLRPPGRVLAGPGSVVVQMSPEEHDRALAVTSHLPHMAAAALAVTVSEPYFRLAGTGLLDTTRLAAGDPGLWKQILLMNRDNVLTALEQFGGQSGRLARRHSRPQRGRAGTIPHHGEEEPRCFGKLTSIRPTGSRTCWAARWPRPPRNSAWPSGLAVAAARGYLIQADLERGPGPADRRRTVDRPRGGAGRGGAGRRPAARSAAARAMRSPKRQSQSPVAGPRAAQAGRDGPRGAERAGGHRRLRPAGRGGPHAEEILDRRPAGRADRGPLARRSWPTTPSSRPWSVRWASSGWSWARRTCSAWSPCRSATMDDGRLGELSLRSQLYLSLAEMQTIRDHFQPTRTRPDRRRAGDPGPDLERALQPQDARRADPLPRCGRPAAVREHAPRDDLRRHREDPRRAGGRRLVRQRLPRQRRRGPVRRANTTSSSRSRRTTTPRPWSPTAGRTPASAA